MSEWDATVREWLVAQGYCYAGGLANASDGAVYSAAASEEEDGWAYLYKDDHDEQIMNENDKEETVTITEANTIYQAITEYKAPHGVWIGGEKYKVVRQEPAFEFNDCTFDCVFCAKPKGGAHMIKTAGGTVVIALYSEEKDQASGNAKQVALAFAEYLATEGY